MSALPMDPNQCDWLFNMHSFEAPHQPGSQTVIAPISISPHQVSHHAIADQLPSRKSTNSDHQLLPLDRSSDMSLAGMHISGMMTSMPSTPTQQHPWHEPVDKALLSPFEHPAHPSQASYPVACASPLCRSYSDASTDSGYFHSHPYDGTMPLPSPPLTKADRSHFLADNNAMKSEPPSSPSAPSSPAAEHHDSVRPTRGRKKRGPRVPHRLVERRYREALQDRLHLLRSMLFPDDVIVSKSEILSAAIEYIQKAERQKARRA